MEKNYDFCRLEPIVRNLWEQSHGFAGRLCPSFQRSKKNFVLSQPMKEETIKSSNVSGDSDSFLQPFTIIMPPPNVTGRLHLGHTLSSTIQDVIARFKRMNGYDVLWVPGTDHAGIATQMMVEKDLAKEGKTRLNLGRKAFLERVWEWKETYGNAIVDQMKHLGFSADWRYLTFTLDAAVSQSVVECFIRLYEKGVLFRSKRLVNWDPQLTTAVSDLEVVNKIVDGQMFYMRYPFAQPDHNAQAGIEIATTRPETLFGDVAVAVHPKDPRYQNFIGKTLMVPLVDRPIPLIADEAVNPEKGTGAVKITPAHDFLDFEIGMRHQLPMINIFDEHARCNDLVPKAFQGLDGPKARQLVLERLSNLELLLKSEPIRHSVPFSERSGATIEPRLTEQWFVHMETIAQKALDAVDSDKTTLFPHHWKKTYDEWLKNIQPWCISRQLWWGHRIPVWYGPDGTHFVGRSLDEALKKARSHYGIDASKTFDLELRQDDDVLDTWFSSALWPFSTLGWPEKTPELERYYPTDLLVTGSDILFFWVARMMMMGLEMTETVPFHTVLLHPLIRDQYGQKMSKTKGNVVDPLELVQQYGADALRFSLMLAASPLKHIRFSIQHVENSRNFITKIWNAGRFCMGHFGQNLPLLQKYFTTMDLQHFSDIKDHFFNEVLLVHNPINRWFVQKICQKAEVVGKHIDTYQLHEGALQVYQGTWELFCDWYLELFKTLIHEKESKILEESLLTLLWGLGLLLKMLHPFVPFVTESLWGQLQEIFKQILTPNPVEKLVTNLLSWDPLALEQWPSFLGFSGKKKNLSVIIKHAWPFEWIQDLEDVEWTLHLISQVRGICSAFNIPKKNSITLRVVTCSDCALERLKKFQGIIVQKLALNALQLSGSREPHGQAGRFVLQGCLIEIEVTGTEPFDFQSHIQRIKTLASKVLADRQSVEKRLQQAQGHAPEEILLELEERLEALALEMDHYEQLVQQLEGKDTP
jgi:valyl-tRNA synthetase